MLIVNHQKRQTRCEAGTESHGSLHGKVDSRVAWDKAVRLYFDTEEVHMTKLARYAVLAAILVLALALPASAALYTFDEFGISNYQPGYFSLDSGPGNLGVPVLTYNLPFAGVQGDLLAWEVGSQTLIADVIRFDGAGHLFFYSDVGVDAPADVGLPTAYHGNQFTVQEVGDEGFNWFDYPLLAGPPIQPTQPGYDPSNPSYLFISDVPLPPSLLFVGSGLLGLLGFGWRRMKG
jgi:hypothetical protein